MLKHSGRTQALKNDQENPAPGEFAIWDADLQAGRSLLPWGALIAQTVFFMETDLTP